MFQCTAPGEREKHSDNKCELVIIAFQWEVKPEAGSCWLIKAFDTSNPNTTF